MLYLPEKTKMEKVALTFPHLFCQCATNLWKGRCAEMFSFLTSLMERSMKKSLDYLWPKANSVSDLAR